MKLVSPTRQLMVAAILALVMLLVWPLTGALASQTHAQAHVMSTELEHAHTLHQVQLPSIHVDCQASDIGCCMMALCHPALTIPLDGITFVGADGETESTGDANASGRKIDVAVPPPRALPV